MRIVNLTMQPADAWEIAAGVKDLEGPAKAELYRLIDVSLDAEMTQKELQDRAADIAELAAYCGLWESPPSYAMLSINMRKDLRIEVEGELTIRMIQPCYAYAEQGQERGWILAAQF